MTKRGKMKARMRDLLLFIPNLLMLLFRLPVRRDVRTICSDAIS